MSETVEHISVKDIEKLLSKGLGLFAEFKHVPMQERVKKMLENVGKKGCPVCGVPLKKIREHEYSPDCEHFRNQVICIG